MTTESENVLHRAGTQRTFHVHAFAGSDRASNQYIVLVYMNYRLMHAETVDTLYEARTAAAELDDGYEGNAFIKIFDEHGTEHGF